MDLLEVMKKKTREWESRTGLRETPEGREEIMGLSDKQARIADLVRGKFGRYRESMAELVSELADIPLSALTSREDSSSPPDVMCVVRLIDNPNAHTYPIGRPLVVVAHDREEGMVICTSRALFEDHAHKLHVGNNLPMNIDAYTPVSEEDIEYGEQICLRAVEESGIL